MESYRCSCVFSVGLLLLSVFLTASASSPAFSSGNAFGSETSIGRRSILQVKKACPVKFEFLNYTIITSKCKGPQYPADLCCSALKEFACPYAKYLNDLTNDCASTMFSYINLYGKYPPGLFASECSRGRNGLKCPAHPPSTSSKPVSGPVRSLS